MALPIVNSSRYEVTIPSMNVKVEYRPFLVKEEKLLMVALESKDDGLIVRSLKDVIRSCVYDDIDVNNLTTFDLEFLFLKLRAKSVGETVELKFPCEGEECKQTISVSLNLEEIELQGIDPDRIVMVTDEVGVQFNYPSLDVIESVSIKPESSQEEQLKATLGLIASAIGNIFDADNVYPASDSSTKELTEFLDELNSSQFKKIADWFSNLPYLAKDVEYKCNKCGHEHNMELRGLQSFFT
jgi:hypothetical protein